MSAQLNLSLFSRRRVPVVKQTEVAECGLACLAMVAGYHGHNIDLGTLRRRFAVAMTGLSLLDLSHFASGLSLSTRAVRAELDELAKLRTPCILHWKLTHYVVLERIGSKGVYICDPAEGRRWASWQEVSESFTGVALELWPSVGFERKTERKSIRPADLFRRTGGLNRALLQIFLLSLCLEAIALLSPIGSQIIFDEVVVASDHELLTLVAIGMACLVVLQVVFGLARSWAALVMGTSLSVQWTAALFDHMLNLPLAYFEKRHVGDVVSRFGSLGNIQSALTTDVISILMDGIMIIGTLVMMILYGGWMALVACGALTIHLFMRMIAYGPYRAATHSTMLTTLLQINNSAALGGISAADGMRKFAKYLPRYLFSLKSDKMDIRFVGLSIGIIIAVFEQLTSFSGVIKYIYMILTYGAAQMIWVTLRYVLKK